MTKLLDKDRTNFACATCHQVVGPRQFHSYESCLIWKQKQGTLTDSEHDYIWNAGLTAMLERHKRKTLP